MSLRTFAMMLVSLSSLLVAASSKEVEIPRSAYKDIYKYYAIEVSEKAKIYTLTYKRLSHNTMSFGRLELHCALRQVREMGQSNLSVKHIQNNPQAWYAPRIGTFQSDALAYLCH